MARHIRSSHYHACVKKGYGDETRHKAARVCGAEAWEGQGPAAEGLHNTLFTFTFTILNTYTTFSYVVLSIGILVYLLHLLTESHPEPLDKLAS